MPVDDSETGKGEGSPKVTIKILWDGAAIVLVHNSNLQKFKAKTCRVLYVNYTSIKPV